MSSMRRLCASLFLLAVLSHLNSIPGAFHYDDAHSIVENRAIRDLGNILHFFIEPALFSNERNMAMYRPLVTLSYAFNYALDGLQPRLFLLVNLLLYGMVAVCALLVLERWLKNAYAAWWGAAIFALHPLNAQVVNYISSRSESLAALGILLALYLHARGQRSFSLAAYALGLLAKSQAVVLLPLLWVWGQGQWRSRLYSLLPFVLLTSVYLGIVYANRFLPRSLAQDVRPIDVQFFTQVKALVYYAKLLFFPSHLSVEHAFHESQSLLEAPVLAALALVASLLFMALRSDGWAAKAFLFFLAALSLTSVVPLNVLVNEHRVYIGSLGFCAAVLGGLAAERRAALARWGWIYLLLLALLTWQRNSVWTSEYALWSQAAERGEMMFRTQSNLGLALYERGDLRRAAQVLERALELNAHYARTWNNLGLVYEAMAQYGRAESAYQQAIDIEAERAGFRANMGRLYLGLGRYGEAIQVLSAALEMNPHSVEARISLGLAHQRAGRVQEAIGEYERALDNLTYEAYNNLGLAYQSQGRIDEAERIFVRAIELDAGGETARVNLRLLQLRRRDLSALVLYETLVAEFPQQGGLWRALTDEYARSGRIEEAIGACEKLVELEPHDAQAADNLRKLRALLPRRGD